MLREREFHNFLIYRIIRDNVYYLIHATDHPEAPLLMYRAYNHTTLPKETPEQLPLELGLSGRRGR